MLVDHFIIRLLGVFVYDRSSGEVLCGMGGYFEDFASLTLPLMLIH